jgi:transcriptional regulator NrdR family protein
MSKNDKTSNNTNASKKEKIGENENNPNQLNNNINSNKSNRRADQENEIEKNIVIKRSTGREEKFDTNRLAQTSSRSGIPFAMAKDIAHKTAEKVQNSIKKNKSNEKIPDDYVNNNQTSSILESEDKIVVTADQIKNLVTEELKERNRPEVSSSLIGEPATNNSISNKPSVNDREPIQDNIAANKNRLRFDPGKVHKDERAA